MQFAIDNVAHSGMVIKEKQANELVITTRIWYVLIRHAGVGFSASTLQNNVFRSFLLEYL